MLLAFDYTSQGSEPPLTALLCCTVLQVLRTGTAVTFSRSLLRTCLKGIEQREKGWLAYRKRVWRREVNALSNSPLCCRWT